MRFLILAAGILSMALSACAPQAPATADPAEVQATAMAVAATIIAETRAASSPTPASTETPPPSPTPLPSPTVQFLPTIAPASPTSATGEDNCLHPLDMAAAGPTHKTLIKNDSGGSVNLSLNLYEPNAFGQCGAISYANLARNSSTMAGLPAGYWFAYGWVTRGQESFKVTGSFYVQPAMFEKMELCIREGRLLYEPGC